MSDNRYGPLSMVRWLGSRNLGTVPIPPWSVVQVIDGESNLGNNVWQVDQPGSASNPGFNTDIAFTREFTTASGGIPSVGFGTVTADAPCWVTYDTGSPAPNQVWGIKPGQWTLTANGVGNFEIWRVHPTQKRVYGVWRGIDKLIVKPSGAVAYNSMGTGNVYCGAAGSETICTGWTVSFYNRLSKIDSSQFVTLELIDGQWYSVSATTAAGLIAVTLTATVSGGSATASLATSTGQAGGFGSEMDTYPPSGSITVYDPLGSGGPFNGFAPGTGVLAHYDKVNNKYWILGPGAGGGGGSDIWVLYTLYVPLATSDASQALCPVVTSWGGSITGTITITNAPSVTGGRYQFFGPSGAYGLAVYDATNSVYRIVWQEHQALFVDFTLTEDMGHTTPGQASATRYLFSNGADPGSSITVFDTNGFFPYALGPSGSRGGAVGTAQYNSEYGRYEIVNCDSQAGFIAFTLYNDMSSGSAPAIVNKFWGSQQDTQDPDPSAAHVDVYDPGGSSGTYSAAKTNASGVAAFDSNTNKYWILNLDHKARWISGTISSLTSSVGASTTMTVSYAHDGPSPGSTVTVYDTDGLWPTITTTTKCKAYYNPDDGKYYLLWIKC